MKKLQLVAVVLDSEVEARQVAGEIGQIAELVDTVLLKRLLEGDIALVQPIPRSAPGQALGDFWGGVVAMVAGVGSRATAVETVLDARFVGRLADELHPGRVAVLALTDGVDETELAARITGFGVKPLILHVPDDLADMLNARARLGADPVPGRWVNAATGIAK